MIKTSLQIEGDFYRMIKAHPLGKMLKGEVYRHGNRPTDATTEDAVVSFLSGLDTQLQTGIVVMNVYVPNIAPKISDTARLEEIESQVHQFLWDNETDYYIETEQTPHIEEIEDTRQTCLVVRFRFSRMTN